MHHVERSIYHVTGDTDEVRRRAHADLLPSFRGQAGFLAYDLIEAGERVTSTSTWQSREQAEEAGRQSAGWVRENFSALAVQLEEQSVAPAATTAHADSNGRSRP